MKTWLQLKSMLLWIISMYWWISSCQSSTYQNLRRNLGEDQCMSELMSVDLLSDDQFSASSHLQNSSTFHPSMARLLDIHSQSSSTDGKAWCPATPVFKNLTEFIEIDFRRMTFLRALYTMGRGDGNFKKFSPEILIKYQRTKSGPWYTYRDLPNETIIPINTDARTKLRTSLHTIVATRIRIYPLDTRTGPRHVCLKIAFLGCYFDDEVVSYTAPQGDRDLLADRIVDLRDQTYDGIKAGLLQNGLGKLMDNMVHTSSQESDYDVTKDMSTFFTGWKCTEARRRSPISITFYFDKERVFSQISIYYYKNVQFNVLLTASIVISVGYDNETHRSAYNHTAHDMGGIEASENVVKVPLDGHKGTICTINLTCGIGNWIILDEVQIKSSKSANGLDRGDHQIPLKPRIQTTTVQAEANPTPIHNSIFRKKDFSLLIVVGLVIILVMIIFSCVAFLLYKIKRMRKHKLNKKLELVAKCTDRSLGDPSSRTVFTIRSKHPSMSSISRPAYYSDNKCAVVNPYNVSPQPCDAVYSSWPNTDEEADTPNVEKEEEKCLLETDINDNRSMGKDYAIYQPGGNQSGNEYFHNIVPSPTVISLQNINLNDKVPLSVAHLKIVSSYDLPKSSPIVTYRNNKILISYQHFINYGGICGDVDIRYQSSPTRLDFQGMDSNIKVLPATALLFVKPCVRGQYGSVDIVTMATDVNDSCNYFMKSVLPDSPPAIRSKFILDLRILSTLNISSLARLAAIVVDGDLLSSDVVDVIRSGRFCFLVEYSGGCNLKEFLRSTCYPNATQNYKQTPQPPSPSPISTSTMMLIATQISSGLRHLEELGLSHRDVGCRNCTIDSRRHIKIYPGGYVTIQPFEDYCSIEIQNHLIHFPLRWLAPESISSGVFTSKSDVWSFGVTMWEIFTLCSLVPYPSLSNEALLELMLDRENSPRLMCPQNCPREIYDLMVQCWSWDESLRPRFLDINLFLQIKTNGSTTSAQFTLPGPPPSVANSYLSV